MKQPDYRRLLFAIDHVAAALASIDRINMARVEPEKQVAIQDIYQRLADDLRTLNQVKNQ